MAQLRYECSHCTKLSCNHAAATQHNRDAHGGQANILPERSKAQMRVNDFAQRAEIARLRALSTLSPIAAAAGLVADGIDADMRTFNQCLDEEPATGETKAGHFFAQILRRYSRALAEQEKADD